MGIIKWLKERRARVDDDRYWGDFFSKLGLSNASGELITHENSLQVSTVFACVRVLSESIASLPLIVYRRSPDGGKEPALKHYLYPLLKFAPNEFQTSYEFREMMMGHKTLRGNAYAWKQFNDKGQIIRLIPLDASKMVVERRKGKTIYKYTTERGKFVEFSARVIWHWKGITQDGVNGLSPITLARESVGLAKSAEKHGARFFANDAAPSGILKTPGKLDADAARQMKEDWQSAGTKGEKFKVAVMHGGLDWQAIGMSNEDSQFLETRAFQVEDIARIFRVPSLLINHPDKTATFASAEQFFLSFAVHTIRPHLVRIEQSIYQNILTQNDRDLGIFVEFNINALLRGDVKTRNEAYRIGREWGWLSANDIRKLENMNPLKENGDIYIQPLNFKEAGAPDPAPAPNNTNNINDDDDETKSNGDRSNGERRETHI